MTRIQLWNGDICELEVDAIVTAANPTLWMSVGVAKEIRDAAGDAIELAAVGQAPVDVGDAVVTPAGKLAARFVIHAVSLDRDRKTSAANIEAAIRSAFARARERDVTSLAIPSLGSGVGGFPLEESARVTVETVREELRSSPAIESLVLAIRGAATFATFEAAINAPVGIEIRGEPSSVVRRGPGVSR